MYKKTRLLLLIIVLVLLAGCNFSFSTANISEAGMTSAVDQGIPVDTVTSYPQSVEVVYVYGVLDNAPDDTTIRFVWNYDTDPQEIYTVEMNNEGESGIYVLSSLTLDDLWPTGDYSVDIYIDDREEPDKTVKFTVE